MKQREKRKKYNDINNNNIKHNDITALACNEFVCNCNDIVCGMEVFQNEMLTK
jgi:hypothetical protein